METNFSNLRSIAIVIFAHNEAPVIQKTVQFAKSALDQEDALFVIADNCTDDTAAIAHAAGAKVYRRDNISPYGKGAALSWLTRVHGNILKKYWRLVILDADTLISPDFLNDLKNQISNDTNVFQCFVYPIGYEHSPISTLIALSEMIEQSVFNRLKSFLGWPIRLRGTGMVIHPELLCSIASQVQTDVEDIVLTLLITEKNINIAQLSSIYVYDPKPVETSAASRQRARWFRGQWTALWLYRSAILRTLSQGIKGLSLIATIFLKPRWLMMTIKFFLALFCYQVPILAAFWVLLFSLDILLISIGILSSKERMIFIKTLIFIPGFVFMWLRSIRLSFQRLPWLRVRDPSFIPNHGTFTHPGLLESKKLN
jgi:cellulose synthase/poly-beta-1,6-N-acetylglucosamine synthase-like glycosyltransferase